MPTKPYHLLDIVSRADVGDSIRYLGSDFAHVVKAKGIDSIFQREGTLIGLDAKISAQRISRQTCMLVPSYNL